MQNIAEKTDLATLYDSGFSETAEEIIASVETFRDSIDRLSRDLDWFQEKNELQRARIIEMERPLGSLARENSVLAQRIAQQAKTSEVFLNGDCWATGSVSSYRDDARFLNHIAQRMEVGSWQILFLK